MFPNWTRTIRYQFNLLYVPYPGNLLVILSFAQVKKLRRVHGNLFIISLALADLIVGTQTLPIIAVNVYTGTDFLKVKYKNILYLIGVRFFGHNFASACLRGEHLNRKSYDRKTVNHSTDFHNFICQHILLLLIHMIRYQIMHALPSPSSDIAFILHQKMKKIVPEMFMLQQKQKSENIPNNFSKFSDDKVCYFLILSSYKIMIMTRVWTGNIFKLEIFSAEKFSLLRC